MSDDGAIRLRPVITQLLRYTVIGAGSVAIYVSLVWIVSIHLSDRYDLLVNFTAYGIATLFNYAGNYLWSFKSRKAHSKALPRYLSVVLAGLALNSLSVAALTAAGLELQWAALLFACTWPLISFLALKLWALR